MQIWTISDTHCRHLELKIPDADMVIHCGDATNSRVPGVNVGEYHNFLDWFSNLPMRHKVLIAGNHDTSIESRLVTPEFIKRQGITYLEHELAEVGGIKIFGSPYTPAYGDWSFTYKRNKGQAVWYGVPKCDILVTHGPEKGYLDLTKCRETKKPVQVGCKSLYNVCERIKPKYHLFGHIHQEDGCNNYGIMNNGERVIANCSCYDYYSNVMRNGHIIEV